MNNKNNKYENKRNPTRIDEIIRIEYPHLEERIEKIGNKQEVKIRRNK